MDTLIKAIHQFSGPSYYDLRAVMERGHSLYMENGIITANKAYTEVGVHARSLHNGYWGSASTVDTSLDSLIESLQHSFQLARIESKNSGKTRVRELSDAKLGEQTYTWPARKPFENIDISEKISDMKYIHSLISKIDFVKTVVVRLTEWIEHRIVVTSDGGQVIESKPYLYLGVSATGMINGRRVSAYHVIGRIDGYTVFDNETHEEIAEKVLLRMKDSGNAVEIKPGRYETIVSPHLIGTLIHEAFGHLAEADLVSSGSVLAGRRGERIAPEFITVKDSPAVEHGFGNLRFDDEAVLARDAVIVDKGILQEFMVDREHAAEFGQKPTGNARAEGYRVRPLIRMRNTIVEPGDWTLEEMIEDIEHGVLLGIPLGGEASLDGTFQVGLQNAYEIRRGEIVRPILASTLSGNSIEILANAVALSRDFEVDWGYCGKIQTVPVSSGGPYLRVSKEGAPVIGSV